MTDAKIQLIDWPATCQALRHVFLATKGPTRIHRTRPSGSYPRRSY